MLIFSARSRSDPLRIVRRSVAVGLRRENDAVIHRYDIVKKLIGHIQDLKLLAVVRTRFAMTVEEEQDRILFIALGIIVGGIIYSVRKRDLIAICRGILKGIGICAHKTGNFDIDRVIVDLEIVDTAVELCAGIGIVRSAVSAADIKIAVGNVSLDRGAVHLNAVKEHKEKSVFGNDGDMMPCFLGREHADAPVACVAAPANALIGVVVRAEPYAIPAVFLRTLGEEVIPTHRLLVELIPEIDGKFVAGFKIESFVVCNGQKIEYGLRTEMDRAAACGTRNVFGRTRDGRVKSAADDVFDDVAFDMLCFKIEMKNRALFNGNNGCFRRGLFRCGFCRGRFFRGRFRGYGNRCCYFHCGILLCCGFGRYRCGSFGSVRRGVADVTAGNEQNEKHGNDHDKRNGSFHGNTSSVKFFLPLMQSTGEIAKYYRFILYQNNFFVNRFINFQMKRRIFVNFIQYGIESKKRSDFRRSAVICGVFKPLFLEQNLHLPQQKRSFPLRCRGRPEDLCRQE